MARRVGSLQGFLPLNEKWRAFYSPRQVGDITVDAFIACDDEIAFAGGNSIRDHSWKMTRPTGETFLAGFEEICLMLAHAEVFVFFFSLFYFVVAF